jgi:hypothetical protein
MKGGARPAASIESRYSSVPPQLAFWRAVKAGHLLLASVCAVAFSSNLLAVALSGLLFERPTEQLIPLATTWSLLPQFNGSSIFNRSSVVVPITYLDHLYVAMSNISENTVLPPWTDQKSFYLPFSLISAPSTSATGASLTFQGFRGSTVGFSTKSTCTELLTSGDKSVLFEPASNDTSAQFKTSYTLQNGSTVDCFPHTAYSGMNETTQFTSSPSTGPSALEVLLQMTPANDTSNAEFCGSVMVAGWVRLGADSTETTNRASNATFLDRSLNYTFLSCTQRLQIAPFDVVVDAEGHILNAHQTGPFVTDTSDFMSGNASENSLFRQSNELIAAYSTTGVTGFKWHNDSFTSDWMNALMGMTLNSDDLVNPSTQVPTASEVAPLMEHTYQRLFAILLGLNTHVFAPASDGNALLASVMVVESRIFVSRPMFIISTAILILHLIVAIYYYTHRPRRFLPRMPTSIGSIIAFVTSSRALEDFEPRKASENKSAERSYGYGRFIGTDGKTRVGIEKQRYVVPLKSRNPEAKQRKKWNWRGEGAHESEIKTWI